MTALPIAISRIKAQEWVSVAFGYYDGSAGLWREQYSIESPYPNICPCNDERPAEPVHFSGYKIVL